MQVKKMMFATCLRLSVTHANLADNFLGPDLSAAPRAFCKLKHLKGK